VSTLSAEHQRIQRLELSSTIVGFSDKPIDSDNLIYSENVELFYLIERTTPRTVTLTLLLLILLLLLTACEDADTQAPRAHEGALDLREWDFKSQGSVPLAGTWKFFPNEFLEFAHTPVAPEIVSLPAPWNQLVGDSERNSFGYGTYVIDIKLPKNASKLGLSLKSISSAYEVHTVSGVVASAGRTGKSAASSEPGYKLQIVPLHLQGSQLSLFFHVSNFDHARGGLWDNIWIGDQTQLQDERSLRLNLNLFLASTALIIGLYHFLIWLLRRQDSSPLVFGFVCLSLSLRTLTINEIYLLKLFPNLPYEALLRLEYGSLLVLTTTTVVFMWNIFRGEFQTRYLTVLVVPMLLYFVLVLFATVAQFTAYLYSIHLAALYAIAACCVVLPLAIWRRREGARLYTASIGLFLIFIVHDIVTTLVPQLSTPGDNKNLVPFGFIAVLLAQALVLATRSTGAMRDLENSTEQLSEAQHHLDLYAKELEQRVAERTASLEEANAKLDLLARVDELTQLANRREFDHQLIRIWADHLRRNVALSIVFVDVDHFKGYNDHYGHVHGDGALVAISGALTEGVRRSTDLVARYGGEEMVALLPNTSLEAARGVAEGMRKRVEALNMAHEKSDYGILTISLGVASVVPSECTDPESLVELADKALYVAKTNGRNRVITSG
jgi:diguanylate cyclase (GGDEF)-like protein